MPTSHLAVTWIPGASAPTGQADPAAPRGTILEAPPLDSTGICWTALPSPAPGVGVHVVECRVCGVRVACGAAGGPADPRAVRLPCRPLASA